MDIQQIISLCHSPVLTEVYGYEERIETHSAWILLCNAYVFKIKKPVKFRFLDYSELSKRKFYCEEELRLNSRFAPKVYIKVLPITVHNNSYHIGDDNKRIIDYAVMMRRLKDSCFLSNIYKCGLSIKTSELQLLAAQIGSIHKASDICSQFDYNKLAHRLNQVLELEDDIYKVFGVSGTNLIEAVTHTSNRFLSTHKAVFSERLARHFIRGVHGDLHTGNIHMSNRHISIIDCIEFNANYRNIDLLDDIAAILVDFDLFSRVDDANTFLTSYNKQLNAPHFFNQRLLNYYKMQRAVTRFSVCLLDKTNSKNTECAYGYYTLIKNYLKLLHI
ncbi:hypothetical protein [Snuella sedimenti]|uniref:Aminoglycoside phosphotransferase domain-containing protein n=1 Tax=Snuella sedimenti TaxID=2798802 RepID=A0A8J7II58_9FLAO|nr:hypothetical protein [Snuella sedimenti]MBJ6369258.1 hypothetical protein [Snuella sedimenti]